MNKKNISMLTFILVLIAAILYLKKESKDTFLAIDNTLIRSNTHIIYTKHARCRMNCRHFGENEVEEILAEGRLNQQKSNLSDKPCPTFALEGRTSDGQLARMVFAQCANNTLKLVTCIDLETDYPCDCY